MNPKSSQPRHAASLFMGGTTWLLRQGALSRSLSIGGGGGNSVLKGGVRPCGGKVHLKLPRYENGNMLELHATSLNYSIRYQMIWTDCDGWSLRQRNHVMPLPPAFPKHFDEIMEQKNARDSRTQGSCPCTNHILISFEHWKKINILFFLRFYRADGV